MDLEEERRNEEGQVVGDSVLGEIDVLGTRSLAREEQTGELHLVVVVRALCSLHASSSCPSSVWLRRGGRRLSAEAWEVVSHTGCPIHPECCWCGLRL